MAEKTRGVKRPKQSTDFKINRTKEIEKMYSDDVSTSRRYGKSLGGGRSQVSDAAGVREALKRAISDRDSIVKLSQELYATNPIYSQLIEYLSNMYMWRYKVTPHKIFTTSKAKAKKTIKEDDYMSIYRLMLEVVDGLSIETKFPLILSKLFIEGSVYLTTFSNEDSITINSLLLPSKYCRKIGETQYGTAIIQFDFSYFADLGLTKQQLEEYFLSFPDEFQLKYKEYLKDRSNSRWQDLDPTFSTGILLNDYGIPTFIYALGGILDYEKYQSNELKRNENLLKYLVVQTMPIYEDRLIFEMDEVTALHNSMKKVIDKGEEARLLTTFGKVNVEKIADRDTTENQVLSKSFKTIFQNAGLNSGIFTGESVQALKFSLVRDRGFVWKYVQTLLSFYSIAINNWYDFRNYQADIDILPISSYTYNDDIKVYKENATLGVGKVDYFIASGIRQIHLEDMLELEKYLHLDRIEPMKVSYTQTAETNEQQEPEKEEEDDQANKEDAPKEDNSGIEPTEENTPEE